ncbi:UDP-N-acetylmuramate dehydrogenase, partial [Parabacteroides distasonis]
EGLVDLPGTIGAAIFGNSGCYDCSITSLLEYCEVLRPDGTTVRLSKDDLGLSKRSTVLKRKEVDGIILLAFLSKRKGDPAKLQVLADINRRRRRTTQPGPAKNLGSDFANVGKVTLKYRILMLLCRVYYLLYHLKIHLTRRQITSFILKIVGHKELIPYLEWGWNRFIWKDESAFVLFNVYKKLYLSFFQNDRLEIIENK